MMDLAVQRVLNKELSLRSASRLYKFPYATLHSALKRSTEGPFRPPGRMPALLERVEKVFVDIFVAFGTLGRPLDRSELFEASSFFISSLPEGRRCEPENDLSGGVLGEIG